MKTLFLLHLYEVLDQRDLPFFSGGVSDVQGQLAGLEMKSFSVGRAFFQNVLKLHSES